MDEMHRVAADPAALQHVAGLIADRAAELDRRFERAAKQADDVLGGTWRGQLADRARSGWDEWVEGYVQAREALTDTGRLLAHAASDYTATDDASAARFPDLGGDKELNL